MPHLKASPDSSLDFRPPGAFTSASLSRAIEFMSHGWEKLSKITTIITITDYLGGFIPIRRLSFSFEKWKKEFVVFYF